MVHRICRFCVLPLLTLLLLAPLAALPTPASAQSERCFDETNYCISGNIRAYWEAEGGLPVFGYPISDVYVDTVEGWTGPIQWFERDRLEDHSADGQGVLAGRLGARLLELKGTPWEEFDKVPNAPVGCQFFAQTGHSVCEPFLSYWLNNGGLERFGYPITESYTETIGDWTGTIQYFERRRMEHHTDNAGTPFEVLLGLLGREVRSFVPTQEPLSCDTEVVADLQATYEQSEIDSFRRSMGCPTELYDGVPAAVQSMERGLMIWADTQEDPARDPIWAYSQYGYYEVYPDTFTEGTDPEVPAFEAPQGLFLPRRGFGKVWGSYPDLRDDLGYAVEATERPVNATVQSFDGGVMVWIYETEQVFIGGTPEVYGEAVLIPRVME